MRGDERQKCIIRNQAFHLRYKNSSDRSYSSVIVVIPAICVLDGFRSSEQFYPSLVSLCHTDTGVHKGDGCLPSLLIKSKCVSNLQCQISFMESGGIILRVELVVAL